MDAPMGWVAIQLRFFTSVPMKVVIGVAVML